MNGMFPRWTPWLYWGPSAHRFDTGWKQLIPWGVGSDEWGRHTTCFGIPYVVWVIVPRRACTCEEEMEEFKCTFPGCPFHSMSPGGKCVTHDEEFWADYLTELVEDGKMA